MAPENGLYGFEQYLHNLSSSGGNYVRVWLTDDWNDMFLETRLANYSLPNAYHIDALLQAAERTGVRVLLTIESFNLFCSHSGVRPCPLRPLFLAQRHGEP